MKNYELASEDEQFFSIKHPDGSTFSIAKLGISPILHKKIKALKMADGGVVPEDNEEVVLPTVAQPINTVLPVAPVGQVAPVPVAQPTKQAMPAPEISLTPEADYAKAFAQKEASIRGLAEVQAKEAQAQAQIYAERQKKEEDALASYQAQHAQLDAENKNLTDAIVNQKIDPNRLYNNMGTAGKVGSAIMTILGGIGAGLSGGRNVAADVLHDAINKDIDAQKAELGKKNSLLSENLRRFGDLNTATQMTSLQLNAITQAKIAQAVAASGSDKAAANAQGILADLSMQAAQIKGQLAAQKALSTLSSGGGLSNEQVSIAPAEVRERAVRLGDKNILAFDRESAKEARKIVGASDAMMSNLDELIKLRQEYGSATIPGPVANKMKTIASNLQLSIKEAKQLGTLDKGAEKFMEKLVADPTSYGFVSDQYKALKETQNRETFQKLKALGLNISPEMFSQESKMPVERLDPSTGKTALFDPTTKKFLRYK